MRILLADDHPVVLEGIEHILEHDGGFDVVATTGSGAAVLPLVGRHHPEVVLLDMRLPKLDGLGCLGRLSARYPIVKVIMLSMFAEPEQVQLAFARGACGYLEKSMPASDLPAAIRHLTNGTARSVFGHAPLGASTRTNAAGLTDRELTTLKAVARGLSNEAVGDELWITEQTVKFHLTNVFRKLGVANRTAATRWAYAHGLADPEPEPPRVTACA